MSGYHTPGDEESHWIRHNVSHWWAVLVPKHMPHRALLLDAARRMAAFLVHAHVVLASISSAAPCEVRREGVLSVLQAYKDIGMWARAMPHQPGTLAIASLSNLGPVGALQKWISEVGRVVFAEPWSAHVACDGGGLGLQDMRIRMLAAVAELQGIWPWLVDSAAVATAARVEAVVPSGFSAASGDASVVGMLVASLDVSCPLVVEIGVDAGGLSTYLLESFPALRLVGIDPYLDFYGGVPSSERKDGMGGSRFYDYAVAQYERFLPRGQLLRLPSLVAVKNWTEGLIDLVFIDAEHDFQSCTEDIQAWAPLVRQNGIVAGDDYVSGVPGVTRAVRDQLPPGSTLNLAPHGVWWWIKP